MVRMFLVNALVTRSGHERRPAEGSVFVRKRTARLEFEFGSDTLFSFEGVRLLRNRIGVRLQRTPVLENRRLLVHCSLITA